MRRLVLILGSLAAALVAAVLLLPWWLGAALTSIGPSFGLTFGNYARQGYSRFQVETVAIRRAAVTVKIAKIEADTPSVWLWRRVSGNPGTISAGAWSVDVRPTQSERVTGEPRGWVPLRKKLEMVADRLAYWLPRASAGPGTVDWPGGGLAFASVGWENRVLTSSEVKFRALKAAVHLSAPHGQEWRVAASTPDGLGGAELSTEGAAVHGTAKWWGQSADVSARFAAQGWLPTEASLRSKAWDITGENAKLGGHYAHIRGDARLDWREGNLTADVDVQGEPLAGSRAPPIAVKLHGRSRDGVFVAEALDVKIPGMSALLSDPVEIDRHGKLKSQPARFTFEANLSEQPWLQARGTLRGDGRIEAAEDGIAALDFSLAGDDVAVDQIAAKRLEVAGRFAWPTLAIRRGKLTEPDGNEVTASGEWDLRTHELRDGRLSGAIGRAAVARWMPANPQFDTVVLDAHAEGRWPDLKHAGRAEATNVRFPRVNPIGLVATWDGIGLGAQTFALVASAGATRVTAGGSVDRARLRLAELSLINGDARRLALAQPLVMTWKPWRIEPFTLSGPQAAIEGALTWGSSGEVRLSMRQVEAQWLRELFPLRWGAPVVESFHLNGNWADGPATFTADATGSFGLGNDRTGHVQVELRGTPDRLEIVSLRGSEGEGVILDAAGRLPITVHPARRPLAKLDADAPFSFKATTTSNPKFWDEVSRLTGIEIVQPEVNVQLDGSLRQPKGEVRLKADRLAAVPGRYRFEWPKVEALNVYLTANSNGVNLETFSVRVDDQLVRAHGTLPVAGKGWQELVESPRKYIQRGDLRVEVPDAKIAAIAQHFPDYFAPKGRLQLDLSFKPDQTISGFLKVSDATSRPLGPLGVLQEINADVRFAGRAVRLEAVTARMGGQLVTLQGTAALRENDDPQLDFTLKGENLPFVRRSGLLLRGDLDLKLKSTNGNTAIGGDVHLRDSLFLTDLASLIPTGAKETARRPPYFSIEAVPLNRWTLDVNVRGDRFFKLRTPVFNGTASARFHLGGTLGNPRATGEATVDDGNIRLPFASFEVRQGQVRLTPEQPEPQLLVNATTRRYGYDLRLELTGPASAPNLTFSSSPPLEAEQVLLMVMAGEAPHSEIATTDRQRAARFGAFFGQSILGGLGSVSNGADRLTISSGEDISAQGRETYSIEYKLNDKWSLTGEYDEFDDYYGGLKWRFFEKGGKKADGKK